MIIVLSKTTIAFNMVSFAQIEANPSQNIRPRVIRFIALLQIDFEVELRSRHIHFHSHFTRYK